MQWRRLSLAFGSQNRCTHQGACFHFLRETFPDFFLQIYMPCLLMDHWVCVCPHIFWVVYMSSLLSVSLGCWKMLGKFLIVHKYFLLRKRTLFVLKWPQKASSAIASCFLGWTDHVWKRLIGGGDCCDGNSDHMKLDEAALSSLSCLRCGVFPSEVLTFSTWALGAQYKCGSDFFFFGCCSSRSFSVTKVWHHGSAQTRSWVCFSGIGQKVAKSCFRFWITWDTSAFRSLCSETGSYKKKEKNLWFGFYDGVLTESPPVFMLKKKDRSLAVIFKRKQFQ